MEFNPYLFLTQSIIIIIYFYQYTFINVKALIGHNIRQARSGEYSYVVSLMRIEPGHPHSGGDHFCTGILTTRKDVLTAAHCLEEETLNTVQIVIGTIDLRNGTVYFPFWWQTHDQWAVANNITIVTDISDLANLRLIQLVPRNIYPARLSSLSNNDLHGADVVAAAWGVNNQGITPDIMEIANLKVLSNLVCERRMEKLGGERIPVDIRSLCTAAKPYILLEIGDSGGPVLFRNRLVGINKGTSPGIENRTFHKKQVNIHVGTHDYRRFISYMKNLF